MRTRALAAAVAAALAGCSGGPAVSEVEGVVRIDGRPHRLIEVQFLPDDERGCRGPMSTALTDESGRYRLRYYRHSDRSEADGAVVGWHKVLLTDVSRSPRGDAPPPPSALPDQYRTVDETPLAFEVKPGKQTIDIDVTTR